MLTSEKVLSHVIFFHNAVDIKTPNHQTLMDSFDDHMFPAPIALSLLIIYLLFSIC